MAKHRQGRLSEEIKKSISSFLINGAKDPRLTSRIISITGVDVTRDGIVIHEGVISSLRRFKDDVREVAAGYECGLGIEKYNDIKPDDVIECFNMVEVKR